MENLKSDLKYEILFGGGAIRGVAYCGAIKALEEIGVTFDTVAGSSVGSVLAGFVAVGYNAAEITEIMKKVNYELFRDIQIGIGPQFALSRGEVFHDWLREMLESKFYGENYKKGTHKAVTFKDLGKNLVIITTDLSNFECKEFSKFETPDFEVAAAIRISCGMPGLMKPYEYNNTMLVDGDLQKSAPMWSLSENLQPEDTRIMELRLEGAFQGNDKNTVEYLNAIYSYATSTGTKFLKNIYGNRDSFDYVVLDTGDLNILDFNISDEKREELINGGYYQTMDYFKNTLFSKRSHLLEVYKKIDSNLAFIEKNIERNRLLHSKQYLGDLYCGLCDEMEYINETDRQHLCKFKDIFTENISYPALFGRVNLKNEKLVKAELAVCQSRISARIQEYQDYIKRLETV